MHGKARYSCLPFTDTDETRSFHGQNSGVFYALLHDELHRRLISTIPNNLFDALFSAIDLVREKTNVKWSHFLWDTTDLEFRFDFLEKDWDPGNVKANTEAFCQMLSGKLLTQNELLGLFAPDEKNISLWILMINLFENPEKWQEYGIDAKYLATRYAPFYEFIVKNQAELATKESYADKVVFLYLKLIKKETAVSGMTFHFAVKGTKGNRAIVIGEENKRLEKLNNPEFQLSWRQKTNLAQELDSNAMVAINEVWDLKDIVEAYPFAAEAVCDRILNDGTLFRIISNGFRLGVLADVFPDFLHPRILAKVLGNSEFLGRILFDVDSFKGMVQAFPEHKEEIFSVFMSNEAYFKTVTSNLLAHDVHALTIIFKEHKAEIEERAIKLGANLMEEPDNKLSRNHYSILQVLGRFKREGTHNSLVNTYSDDEAKDVKKNEKSKSSYYLYFKSLEKLADKNDLVQDQIKDHNLS